MDLKEQKDLQALIDNNISEDTGLDYKDPEVLNSNAKNKDLAIDVSAMANSDGGTIVYGICENAAKNPSSIKWIEDRSLKEKVSQVVQSRIVPPIEGITYDEIPADGDKNKFVLVLRIPKSYGSPHQVHIDTNRKGYFGRNGSTNRELEHHEVEGLFYRRKGPILELASTQSQEGPYRHTLFLSNKGSKIAEKIVIRLIVPEEIDVSGNGWSKLSSKNDKFFKGYISYQYYNDHIPCFPDLPLEIGSIYSSKKKSIEELKFSFYLTCKDMDLKTFEFTLFFGGSYKSNLLPNNEGLPFPFLRFLGDW